jgi:hypothetical protein
MPRPYDEAEMIARTYDELLLDETSNQAHLIVNYKYE